MTYKEIIASLKKKSYQPVYFLHGEEAYFIDAIADYIEKNVLTEAERSFNQTTFYGKDTDHKTLIDTASRYPMMASHQVVLLKEAQEMKTLKSIQPYIENPVPTTILVICHKYKKFDTRTKMGKALNKNSVVFRASKLYDNQISGWIDDYMRGQGLEMEPNATNLVAEYLGTSLSKIVNEMEKLVINLPKGTKVTDKHIQEHIGISKEFNVFELQQALGERNVLKANRIINYFIANPRKNPMVVVVGTLYNFFSKVYMSYFLKNLSDGELAKGLGHFAKNDYSAAFLVKKYKVAMRNYRKEQTETVLGILKEYDLKSKGVNRNSTTEGGLMKEMIYQILH
ncbi:MAG: DNA polymerase III subunit delta [Saprospiraceae bacterium]